MKRRKMSKTASQKVFTKTAMKYNSLNTQSKPQRGGWRL